MDQVEKLNRYRQIIEQLLETHAKMPAVPETVEGMAVCDPVRDQYLLMDVGWAPYGRAHDVVVHLRLIDVAHWYMGVTAPASVVTSGNRYALNWECPDTITCALDYPKNFSVTYHGAMASSIDD